MNCRRLQNQLFEYLDETLSPGEREAAERHLGQCGACRDVLQRERDVAQRLSERLQKEMSGISLRAGVQGRILAAMADHSHDYKEPFSFASLLVRLAWGGGLAVCVLLGIWLTGGFSSKSRPLATHASPSQDKGSVAVSVDISYITPTYVSRQEGNQMVDTLVQEPRTTSQTIYWVKD